MSQHPDDLSREPEVSKAEIRARGLARRADLTDKDRLSGLICRRFQSLSQFAPAQTVFAYVHIRDEVRTTELVTQLLQSGKRVVVPYCVERNLKLFLLCDLGELVPGTLGILEPKMSLRSDVAKQVAPEQLDLLAVPGVAFDRTGGRVGHGGGYFDRFLPRLRSDASAFGLAFECQLFDRVPMEEYDFPLDGVVTEQAVYRADRRDS